MAYNVEIISPEGVIAGYNKAKEDKVEFIIAGNVTSLSTAVTYYSFSVYYYDASTDKCSHKYATFKHKFETSAKIIKRDKTYSCSSIAMKCDLESAFYKAYILIQNHLVANFETIFKLPQGRGFLKTTLQTMTQDNKEVNPPILRFKLKYDIDDKMDKSGTLDKSASISPDAPLHRIHGSITDLLKTRVINKKIIPRYFTVEETKYKNIDTAIPPGSSIIACISFSTITKSNFGYNLSPLIKNISVKQSNFTDGAIQLLDDDDIKDYIPNDDPDEEAYQVIDEIITV